jgi:serine kinase of HPr protein (carbohydrate metabolism regulator)
MTDRAGASIHASAVKIGDHAVLIRGPSGAGKSRLAFDLILAGRATQIPPAVLVGDDRVHLDAEGDRLIVRPARALEGLIEIRGLGIRACEFVACAPLGLVVDLWAPDAERLPPPDSHWVRIDSIVVPRIPVATGFSPLPLVIAALTTTESSWSGNHTGHCWKGIGNHMHPTIATD